jgi:ring-1,2-phenylacetyl-CoA epoxidase subunit PaaE
MQRLVLHHVFSDEPTDSPLNMGLMDRDKLGEFLRSVVPAPTASTMPTSAARSR